MTVLGPSASETGMSPESSLASRSSRNAFIKSYMETSMFTGSSLLGLHSKHPLPVVFGLRGWHPVGQAHAQKGRQRVDVRLVHPAHRQKVREWGFVVAALVAGLRAGRPAAL